jgi:hypothetical protein
MGRPQTSILLPPTSHSCMLPCPACLWRWGLSNFLPGLALIYDPPHLYLPGMIDMSHHTQS